MDTNHPQFSESICSKIPLSRRNKNFANAMWILRNPVRLSSEEKQELIVFVHQQYKILEGKCK